MEIDATRTSQLASDALTGHYKRKRLTQVEFAKRAGVSKTTLQKKLAGEAPITANDLVIYSLALDLDPAKVLQEVMEELEAQAALSAPVVTLDSRRPKTPAEMTVDELESQRSAATYDAEFDHDEPADT
ncbi:MAG: helix-turn-helix domain-containing protein [Mycetocola sp.]